MREVSVFKKVVLVASICIFDDDVETPEQIAEYITQNNYDLEDYQILDIDSTPKDWKSPTFIKEDILDISKRKNM